MAKTDVRIACAVNAAKIDSPPDSQHFSNWPPRPRKAFKANKDEQK